MATGVAHQHAQAPKRKSSAAGLSGSSRPVKRRASKACHCCRSRKVRCDVVESGIPCTNCRLDEVECVVTEGKRRKKSYNEGDCLHHSPIESIAEKEEAPQFVMFDDIDGLQDLPVPTKSLVVDDANVGGLDYDISRHKPHLIYQTHGHRMTPEERTHRLSALSQQPRMSLNPPMQFTQQMPYYSSTPSRPDMTVPPYIGPIPKRILTEDLAFLQKKGAFYIPEAGIRNELLRSYAQYVHPYLPLLDLQEFLTSIEKNGASGQISLLLFQAVMFAATAYVDMRYLTAMGYVNRKSARKAFFQRVKLLYDFDWEVDRVTVVQAVLLMTYWYESPNDPKDVWHWLGIAISIARTIGLNHSTEESLLSTQKRRLWKRIWWSCYMRDRLVAIGMRRPIRINESDYDVPMLTLEDFETNALPPELCRMLGGCSAVRDGSKRVTLAKMCIAVTEVCKCITNVLSAQYSVLGHKIGITSETTVRLVPRKSGAEPSEVIKCDRELEQWYNELPLELRFFVPGTRDRTNNHDGEVISVHRALLSGIFLTATSALHRPQMMPVSPGLIIAPELKELSKRRVREAALDITEIFRDLYAHDLIRYLPNTGVTVVLPAIIIHLLDIKSTEASDRQTSMRHFQFCMQALQKLREVYSSAEFAFSFLDAATRKVDLSASALSPSGQPSDQHKASKKSLTLTPPPDVQDIANRMRQGSSGSVNSKANSQGFNALTPPLSEQSLSLSVTGGTAISLNDLDDVVDMDGMSETHLEPFPAFSLDATNMTIQPIDTAQEPVQTPTYNNAPRHARSSSTLMNEFDQLINLEGGTDFFAPTKVNIDDNLFKDIDMEWLAEPEHHEDLEGQEGFTAERAEEPRQLKTPESDNSRLSATGARKIVQYEHDERLRMSGYSEVKNGDYDSQQDQTTKHDMTKTFDGFTIAGDLDLDLGFEDD